MAVIAPPFFIIFKQLSKNVVGLNYANVNNTAKWILSFVIMPEHLEYFYFTYFTRVYFLAMLVIILMV